MNDERNEAEGSEAKKGAAGEAHLDAALECNGKAAAGV